MNKRIKNSLKVAIRFAHYIETDFKDDPNYEMNQYFGIKKTLSFNRVVDELIILGIRTGIQSEFTRFDSSPTEYFVNNKALQNADLIIKATRKVKEIYCQKSKAIRNAELDKFLPW